MEDKEIKTIARGFTMGLLAGKSTSMMCFAVSSPLCAYLNFAGLKCELVEFDVEDKHDWYNHWCIKLDDGRILDTTMNQFHHPEDKKIPEVYLGKAPFWYKETVKNTAN